MCSTILYNGSIVRKMRGFIYDISTYIFKNLGLPVYMHGTPNPHFNTGESGRYLKKCRYIIFTRVINILSISPTRDFNEDQFSTFKTETLWVWAFESSCFDVSAGTWNMGASPRLIVAEKFKLVTVQICLRFQLSTISLLAKKGLGAHAPMHIVSHL